ncbi:hypothetical protein [Halorubrum californiense]|uniref:hypothetical protein n=1 Tax=Halorubrum californiense TaxID=416585 RepID=UPI0006781531|nr:hypothetical protein [Halorubrum californiense]
MSTHIETAVGVDACPIGWLATIFDTNEIRTEAYEEFGELRRVSVPHKASLASCFCGLSSVSKRLY